LERRRKEVAIAYFRYYLNTHLEGPRGKKNLSHDSVFVKI
jgi:hypothetical protein